jgi:hypothetical protein
MAQAWNWFWLTAAFLSELAALAALAWWGWTVPDSTGLRIVLAVGAPLVAAVLWGVFAAPRAPVRVRALAVLVKVLVFGAGALALLAIGHPWVGVVLALVAVLSSVLSTPPEGAPVTGPTAG